MAKSATRGLTKKPGIFKEGYLSYNPLVSKSGRRNSYENVAAGLGLARSADHKKKVNARRAMQQAGRQAFDIGEFEDMIEFASMQPGIDPNLVETLIQDASRIQQEGQTKVVVSQQLFDQIQMALQNYNIQKQQIDGMTVERLQTQGFASGQRLMEFAYGGGIYRPPKRQMGAGDLGGVSDYTGDAWNKAAAKPAKPAKPSGPLAPDMGPIDAQGKALPKGHRMAAMKRHLSKNKAKYGIGAGVAVTAGLVKKFFPGESKKAKETMEPYGRGRVHMPRRKKEARRNFDDPSDTIEFGAAQHIETMNKARKAKVMATRMKKGMETRKKFLDMPDFMKKRNQSKVVSRVAQKGPNYALSANDDTIEFANTAEDKGRYGKGFRAQDPTAAAVGGGVAGAAGLTGVMAATTEKGDRKKWLPEAMNADLKSVTDAKNVRPPRAKGDTKAEKLKRMRKRLGVKTGKALGYGALGGVALGGIGAHIYNKLHEKKKS